MFMRVITATMLAVAVWRADAAVTLIRDYRLQAPRDRRVVFAMAVTANQDVLSLVADKEGKWRLSRVHGWLDKEPHEDRIVVPGLVYGTRGEWFGPWTPKLLVTPDGKFVVCIATAIRSQGRGQDGFVSVVDLSQFKVVASIHSAAMPDFNGDFRTPHLDGRGGLVVQAYTPIPRHPGDDSSVGESHVKMAVLSLPGLSVSDSCEYTEWARGAQRGRDGESSGTTLLEHECSGSLSKFVSSFFEPDEAAQADERTRPAPCAFMGYGRHFSHDGRYVREVCLTAHRGFWGNPIVTKSVENISDLQTGKRVGSIDEPIDSVDSRFAAIDGHEYLLLMEGGTRLMVYEITE